MKASAAAEAMGWTVVEPAIAIVPDNPSPEPFSSPPDMHPAANDAINMHIIAIPYFTFKICHLLIR
jgi:hypothetical protein